MKIALFKLFSRMKVVVTGLKPNNDLLNASELIIRTLRENPYLAGDRYLDLCNFKMLPGNTNTLANTINKAL